MKKMFNESRQARKAWFKEEVRTRVLMPFMSMKQYIDQHERENPAQAGLLSHLSKLLTPDGYLDIEKAKSSNDQTDQNIAIALRSRDTGVFKRLFKNGMQPFQYQTAEIGLAIGDDGRHPPNAMAVIMYGIKLEPIPLNISKDMLTSNFLASYLLGYVPSIIQRQCSLYKKIAGISINEDELLKAALAVYNKLVLPVIKPMLEGQAFFIKPADKWESRDWRLCLSIVSDNPSSFLESKHVLEHIMEAFSMGGLFKQLPYTLSELQDNSDKLKELIFNDEKIMKMVADAGVSKFYFLDVAYDMLSEFGDLAKEEADDGMDLSSIRSFYKPFYREFYRFCQEVLKGMKSK